MQKNTWDDDFDLMQDLAKKAGLNCNLDKNKKPLSLGTVFWARVEALRKLFSMEWEYDDFSPEPMALDGTISHALERSFAYFAQDAGYQTGIVMSDQYAGHRLDVYQDYIFKAFSVLRDEFNIWNYHTLTEWIELRKKTPEKIQNFEHIYGAGKFGRWCLKSLTLDNVKVEAFVVSSMEHNLDCIDGIPVKEFDNSILIGNYCVIIAASSTFRNEIRKYILDCGCLENRIFDYNW